MKTNFIACFLLLIMRSAILCVVALAAVCHALRGPQPHSSKDKALEPGNPPSAACTWGKGSVLQRTCEPKRTCRYSFYAMKCVPRKEPKTKERAGPLCTSKGPFYKSKCVPEDLCESKSRVESKSLTKKCVPRSCALEEGRGVDVLTADLGAFAWNSVSCDSRPNMLPCERVDTRPVRPGPSAAVGMLVGRR